MKTTEINGLTVTTPEGAIVKDRPAPNPPTTKITRSAFRKRFTFEERVAIESAADTDPSIRVLLKDQEAEPFIDLSQEDVKNGAQLQVSKLLLKPERAEEILGAPIQPDEIYRG